MSPWLVFSIIAVYFVMLIVVSVVTSRGATSQTFFTGNRQSPWYLVAFGMIGTSISGVTFISIPGEVGTSQFAYFQVVLGYVVGYTVIRKVLLPLYYRLNLVSIYEYLDSRFGFWAYKSGAFFFLLSRVIGAAFRLFLAAMVLQLAIFDAVGIPFWVTVIVTIFLIWVYTFKGGIKTIVWTDTLQTTFLILALIFTIFFISQELDLSLFGLGKLVSESEYSTIFVWDWQSPYNFFKQFISGAFIAIVMTGLDQDLMQKNLTCRNLEEAQKNMYWFTILLVFVNLLFLTLGALLYLYAEYKGIEVPARTDELYPMLAVQYFPVALGIAFILGITAAAYASSDSALAALTTSFCVDFLGFKQTDEETKQRTRTRILVHMGFSLLICAVIIVFQIINDQSVVTSVFKAAGYTYGPLLGMFAFGIFSKRKVRDRWIPYVCVLSPILSYILSANSKELLFGYEFGFEILLVNGLFTCIGLWLLSFGKGTLESDVLATRS
ncbi:MAG: sodium:solute symporter [Bacteroidota bacterium]|jgi:Na+/proline symporter|nr:MAG: sodium:solute symporter [Bacteroidota bacterium]